MNILSLCYEFPPLGGGGARVVAGLSSELAGQGHRIDVVTMGFRGQPRQQALHGVSVHRVPCIRLQRHVCTMAEAATYVGSALLAANRLVGRQRYDVNHTHFILPDGLIAWRLYRRTGLPYVITAHGSDVPGYNPHRLRLAHRLAAPLWRAVIRDAAAVVCPSRTLAALVTAHAPGVEPRVIPNGIEPRRFEPRPKNPRQILVVTRMLERKGVQHVLAAARGLETPFELHVVGDGPYLPALRAQAAQSGLPVRFWGWLDNQAPALRALYETAGIFILPSEAENFPVVLLEAMAGGAAVITTMGTGCAEVVGEAGLLVPPKDPGAIRSALTRLLMDAPQREALAEAGRARVEQRFVWPVVAAQYAAVYRQAAEAGRAHHTH